MSDNQATATIKGRVDAAEFPVVRDALRQLGHVTSDVVDQARTAQGGNRDGGTADAPMRREEAALTLTLSTPPIVITRVAHLGIETADVEKAHDAARKAVLAAGGRITGGGLSGGADGTTARLVAVVDSARFAEVLETLKGSGEVQHEELTRELPSQLAAGGEVLLRERGRIELVLRTPPVLIATDEGFGRTIRDTFAGSVSGLLWSVEKLFVGVSLLGPWLVLAFCGWLLYRRAKRRRARSDKPTQP